MTWYYVLVIGIVSRFSIPVTLILTLDIILYRAPLLVKVETHKSYYLIHITGFLYTYYEGYESNYQVYSSVHVCTLFTISVAFSLILAHVLYRKVKCRFNLIYFCCITHIFVSTAKNSR